MGPLDWYVTRWKIGWAAFVVAANKAVDLVSGLQPRLYLEPRQVLIPSPLPQDAKLTSARSWQKSFCHRTSSAITSPSRTAESRSTRSYSAMRKWRTCFRNKGTHATTQDNNDDMTITCRSCLLDHGLDGPGLARYPMLLLFLFFDTPGVWGYRYWSKRIRSGSHAVVGPATYIGRMPGLVKHPVRHGRPCIESWGGRGGDSLPLSTAWGWWCQSVDSVKDNNGRVGSLSINRYIFHSGGGKV